MRRLVVSTVALTAALMGCGSGGVKSRGAHVDAFKVGGLQQIAVLPPKVAPEGQRPMVLFLYGRGGHASDQLSNQVFFDALRDAGPDAPVFVFAQSNDHSYWHDRRERRWGTYLWKQVIPAAVKRLGIDRSRVAVGGISMGGFGALDMVRLHPGGLCAVGAHSPAIWRTAGETAPGAFDNAADFHRHDLVNADPTVFKRTRHLWLDAGTSDPFDPGDNALLRGWKFAKVGAVVHRWAGGHDSAYWQAHWPQYVRWYTRALKDC